MPLDIRAEAAKYYDVNPNAPNDVPFYQRLIPSPDATVLELGCGTGRVILPLLPHCGCYHGLDISTAMLDICVQKLAHADVPPSKACVAEADISPISS